MKIAIVGYAGVGKTTLTKMLNITGYKVVHVDEVVNSLYESENIISNHIRSRFPCIVDGKIDKKILGNILLKNKYEREELEDLLHKEIFHPIICREENIIVDGVVPRFADYFDVCLFAYVNKEERQKRLRGRGVQEKRIKQIMNVQKDWHKYLK